ncbi:tetratricopeptide repeat protein [Agromyces flavus]|uniref:tetratricopeptide repeat protein n=1 Tax=Agromyces flavus TaxID=589382 RepID=UPI00361582D7
MDDWQRRVDEVWATAAEIGEDAVIDRIDALAAELPVDDPRGPFEAAGARDFAGLEAEAEPRYRSALALGLAGRARVEAQIQLASTVRNLGRPAESLELLDAIGDSAGELADAVAAFRALALATLGRRMPRHPSPSSPSHRTSPSTVARSTRTRATWSRRRRRHSQDPLRGGSAARHPPTANSRFTRVPTDRFVATPKETERNPWPNRHCSPVCSIDC